MSPVTGLARLPGRILLFVHMRKFGPIDRDAIKEIQPRWWKLKACIIRDCSSFLDSSNFTNKANSHTPQVEIHTRQKLGHFCRYFVWEIFVLVTRAGVFMRENFHLVSPRSRSWLQIWRHRDFYEWKSGEARFRKPSQSGRPRLYQQALSTVFTK